MLYNDRLFHKKIVLCLGDVVIFFIALFMSLSVRQLHVVRWEQFQLHLPVFAPLWLIFLVIFFLFDLYHLGVLKNIYRLVYTLFLAMLVNGIVATTFFYTISYFSSVTPKTVLFLFVLFDFLFTLVWRLLFYDFFFANVRYIKKVLVVGSSDINENLSQLIQNDQKVDYSIEGFVSEESGQENPIFKNIRNLGHWQSLQKIIQEHKIEEVVVAFDYKKYPQLVRELSDSVALGVRIYEWPVFYEQVFYKVPSNFIDHFWFIHNLNDSGKKIYERLKRAVDIVLAFWGLIILAILLPFIALGIKLTSPGPIFFRQQRVGLNGKLFTLTKFRSMRTDAEKNGAQWATQNDNRVTSFGKFMRRSRIDELPQLWNIFWGDMSLVGPRPERPEFVTILNEKIPFYYKRHMVLPGVTGFAQIMYPYAASVEDSLEKVGYDLYYIKNRSLFLYFKIMLRTVKIMGSFKGR